MLELYYQDEYGQRSIIDRSEDWHKLEDVAQKHVQEENFDNALTTDEQKTNFTVYYVHFFNPEGDRISAAYAGKKGMNTQLVCVFDENDKFVSMEELQNVENAIPNFYIGEFSKKKGDTEVFYATSAKGKRVETFDSGTLQSKGFYFMKKV
jgi:hypothetical protein